MSKLTTNAFNTEMEPWGAVVPEVVAVDEYYFDEGDGKYRLATEIQFTGRFVNAGAHGAVCPCCRHYPVSGASGLCWICAMMERGSHFVYGPVMPRPVVDADFQPLPGSVRSEGAPAWWPA